MNVEVIEFFPLEINKDILTGTLKIRINYEYVSKRDYSWQFILPGNTAVDDKTGKHFAFNSLEKQNELVKSIRLKGREFVESWMSKNNTTNKKPQGENNSTEQVEIAKVNDSLIQPKQTTSIAKQKQWMDPPTRKLPVNNRAKNLPIKKSF